MKRIIRLIVYCSLALIFVFAAWALTQPDYPENDAVNPANFNHIKDGMTRDDVERILGEPDWGIGGNAWNPYEDALILTLSWTGRGRDHIQVRFILNEKFVVVEKHGSFDTLWDRVTDYLSGQNRGTRKIRLEAS